MNSPEKKKCHLVSQNSHLVTHFDKVQSRRGEKSVLMFNWAPYSKVPVFSTPAF